VDDKDRLRALFLEVNEAVAIILPTLVMQSMGTLKNLFTASYAVMQSLFFQIQHQSWHQCYSATLPSASAIHVHVHFGSALRSPRCSPTDTNTSTALSLLSPPQLPCAHAPTPPTSAPDLRRSTARGSSLCGRTTRSGLPKAIVMRPYSFSPPHLILFYPSDE
jgi:hypothetical protein